MPAEARDTPAQPVRPLARDAETAWRAFLDEHSPLILQVVHLFTRDADQIQDCFLFVCERLRRDNLRRVRRFRAAGTASFPTWLRAVVRNLCLDWRRHRYGRVRLPRAIARLPELDREVFRAIHLQGCSENEAFHWVKAVWPGLERGEFVEAAARVTRSLQGRQWWLLLVRRPRLQSLSPAPAEEDPPDEEIDPADPRADPEGDATLREHVASLRHALDGLPAPSRLLVRLRYEEELTLAQIAALTGLSGPAQVERRIQQAIEELRAAMGARDPAALSVKGE